MRQSEVGGKGFAKRIKQILLAIPPLSVAGKLTIQNMLNGGASLGEPMKVKFMAVGAFLLILGFGLVSLSSLVAVLSYANVTSVTGQNNVSNSVTGQIWSTLVIAIPGWALAAIGGGVLAYGVGSKEKQELG